MNKKFSINELKMKVKNKKVKNKQVEKINMK